jgi:hypothetical protein
MEIGILCLRLERSREALQLLANVGLFLGLELRLGLRITLLNNEHQ